MNPTEMRQWFRSEIEKSEKTLRELESQRNEATERLNSLRVIASKPIDGEDNDSANHIGTSYQFTAATTFLKYGAINLPAELNSFTGDGKGSMTVDGKDYRIGISRKQNRNGRARLNCGAEFKALIRSRYRLGDLLELRIDKPDRFSLFRVASKENTENDNPPSETPHEMFLAAPVS